MRSIPGFRFLSKVEKKAALQAKRRELRGYSVPIEHVSEKRDEVKTLPKKKTSNKKTAKKKP